MQIRMLDRPIKWIGRDTGRLATGPNAATRLPKRYTTLCIELDCLEFWKDYARLCTD